jgi:3-oxoacyl-(acyl-carrier-protein) synthase
MLAASAAASISASAALVSQPLTLRRHAADRCVVHMGEKPKIVVTGLGTVTAVGSGDEFWSNLLGGVSGVDQIASFDASRFPTTIGAECTDFNAKDHFTNPKNIKVHRTSAPHHSHHCAAAPQLQPAGCAARP